MSGWTALYIFVASLVTYWLGYYRGRRDMERELFELAEQINAHQNKK